MKNLTRIIVSTGVLFLLSWPVKLSAQPVSPVHQLNMSTFMDDLEAYYGSYIQMSLDTIENYLTPLLPPNGNGLCSAPAAEATFLNNNTVRFDWPAVPTATQYRAGYINLVTGFRNYFHTTNTEYTFNPVSPNLYLFFFQTQCNGAPWSDVEIGIVDVVVHLEINRDLACKCRFGIEPEKGPEEIPDLLAYPEYDLVIYDTIADEETNRAHLKLIQAGDPITYEINTHCGAKGITIDGEMFYPDADDGIVMFDIDLYGNLGISIDNGDYELKIAPCIQPRQNQGTGINTSTKKSTVLAYPNPFIDELTLRANENVSINILDLYGQKIKGILAQNILKGEVIIIDTSVLAKGMYLIEVNNNGKKEYHKILKIE